MKNKFIIEIHSTNEIDMYDLDYVLGEAYPNGYVSVDVIINSITI